MDRRRKRRWRWVAAVVSIGLAVGVAELALRWVLFHSSLDSAAKDATYYARSSDELWIYRQLFSTSGRWSLGQARGDAARETRIPFYRAWATSLVPDAELGYARAANVRVPCHETTRFGTRGVRDVAAGGPKLLLFGDSYVESAACAGDTLATKVERLAGVDTLNYGVGGYGLDQLFLAVRRAMPQWDRADVVVVVGVIQDDLERVLVKVRTSPKPYFTVEAGALRLHVDHIHPASLDDAFVAPPGRFYLADFVRGRAGFPVYDAMLAETRDARRAQVEVVSRLLFDAFASLQRQGRFGLAFAVLPVPGRPFDAGALAALRATGLPVPGGGLEGGAVGAVRATGVPVLDEQDCLGASGRPDTDLYAELHPTSLGNELLARCLVRDLSAAGLVR